ncbi:hypothetical protein EU527_11645 [Candidatus Thorarchaeota archaeon]|nr:MAG: hypothetical protein EU527_11645 [Candidatus Thorarchaeota archaeon]
MIEEPKNVLEQIGDDPNYLLILAGAIIWYVGFYIGILGGLFQSTGFALVCFATALNAVRRAVEAAWPGLLIGGLVQVIGFYLTWIPFIGNLLIVVGGVAILYFAIPLAIQRGELPIITHLQKLLESQKKAGKKQSTTKSPKDTENNESS